MGSPVSYERPHVRHLDDVSHFHRTDVTESQRIDRADKRLRYRLDRRHLRQIPKHIQVINLDRGGEEPPLDVGLDLAVQNIVPSNESQRTHDAGGEVGDNGGRGRLDLLAEIGDPSLGACIKVSEDDLALALPA